MLVNERVFKVGLLEPSEHDWSGVEAHLSTLADRLMADHHLLDLPFVQHGEKLGITYVNYRKPPKKGVHNSKLDPKTSKLVVDPYETVSIDLPRSILDQIYEIAQEQGVPAGSVVNSILAGVLNSKVLKPGWAISGRFTK